MRHEKQDGAPEGRHDLRAGNRPDVVFVHSLMPPLQGSEG